MDTVWIIKNGAYFDIPEPSDLSTEVDKSYLRIQFWTLQVDAYASRMYHSESSKTALHAVILENLATLMKGKVWSQNGWEAAKTI